MLITVPNEIYPLPLTYSTSTTCRRWRCVAACGQERTQALAPACVRWRTSTRRRVTLMLVSALRTFSLPGSTSGMTTQFGLKFTPAANLPHITSPCPLPLHCRRVRRALAGEPAAAGRSAAAHLHPAGAWGALLLDGGEALPTSCSVNH